MSQYCVTVKCITVKGVSAKCVNKLIFVKVKCVIDICSTVKIFLQCCALVSLEAECVSQLKLKMPCKQHKSRECCQLLHATQLTISSISLDFHKLMSIDIPIIQHREIIQYMSIAKPIIQHREIIQCFLINNTVFLDNLSFQITQYIHVQINSKQVIRR